MARVFLLLGLVALTSQIAWAGVNGRTRLHQADKLASRLASSTQKNARATGEYWSPDAAGTAVLVQRSADGSHGLVLTNHHVARRVPADSQIRFGSAVAHVESIVSQREDLDYSLLRVEFKKGIAPEPAKLSKRAPRAAERVYNVGFPGISALYLELDEGPTAGPFTSFDRTKVDRELDAVSGRVRTINVGRERGLGQVRLVSDPDPRVGHRVLVQRQSFTTDLQTLPGSSGSPVFSGEDHALVGLVWSGGKSHPARDVHWDRPEWTWTEGGLAVPASLILDDLRLRLPALAAGEHGVALRQLVDDAR